MKDLTLGTMLAVFEEIFGRGLFWAMVAAAVVVTLAYAYVLVRDHRVSWRKFLWAQVAMPFGAVAAVWSVLAITSSRIADLGGPVDVILFLAVAAGGAVGAAILVYTLQSLIAPPGSRAGPGSH